jgi:hypothetical protein
MVQESKKKAAAFKLSVPEGYHFRLRTTDGKVGMMYPHLPHAYPGAQVCPTAQGPAAPWATAVVPKRFIL